MEKWQLQQLQGLDLETKIRKTQLRIKEWHEFYNGQVYISFSGGKDSTVLLDIARKTYPSIPAVFVDTGLEYPEIREFVKQFENVIWIKPEMNFKEVIKKYGYPVISKEVSKIVYGARHSKNKKQSYINKLDGLNPDFTRSEYKQMYKKYKFLLDAPFEISNRCCYYSKEKPCIDYEKESGNKAIIGTLVVESRQRLDGWLKTGCNAFDSKRPISKPISFWTTQDILKYLKLNNLNIASVYGEIIEKKIKRRKTGNIDTIYGTSECDRTGCVYCAFGAQCDRGLTRFERLRQTHPKLYEYCLKSLENGGLGYKEVLDFIGVKY